MEEKIEHILSQMTLNEKTTLLAGADLWHTNPIDRLGIPRIKVTDGPNGARGAYGDMGPTSACFPVGVALAATWNPELIQRVGQALGEETRSKGAHILLAPTVNIHRSPLAGRNFECFSEDPHLTGQLASAYITGVQSQGVGACIKHFVCNDSEFERYSISSEIAERPLHEIYLEPFRIALKKAKPWAVMSSYNKVNGVYASENKHTLLDILKGEWGFDGIVMSDWFGTYSRAAANGGLDLEMPGPGKWMVPAKLKNGVEEGEIKEDVLDDKIRRLLRIFFRVGAFTNPVINPEQGIDKPEHRSVAFEAASEAVVLLRNKDSALPLQLRDIDSIAVIGSNAKYAQIMGGGSSRVTPHYRISPLESITNLVGERAVVNFAIGCPIHRNLPEIDMNWLTTPIDHTPGLHGEIFDDLDFGGKPVKFFAANRPRITWSEELLHPADPAHYAVRLSGIFVPPETGKYAFSLEGNGKSRLLINDHIVVANWDDKTPGIFYWSSGQVTGNIELDAGKSYKIQIEISSVNPTPWRGLQIGCLPPIGDDPIAAAVALASESDVVILFVGTTDEWESEGYDRSGMKLPGYQDALIHAVLEANPNTIIVLNTGSPITMKWLEKTQAVLQAWFGGQEMGNAIAAALFGNINPSGKLPATFPVRLEDNPAFINYPGENGKVHYGEGLFVGYRYYDKKDIDPLFPFGYGLSYTTFDYTNLRLYTDDLAPTEEIKVFADITNTGQIAGKEIVQLYLKDVESSFVRPEKELKAFKKINLQPGETKTVELTLTRDSFAFYNPVQKSWVTESGKFHILLGSSSQDIHLTTEFAWKGDPKSESYINTQRNICLPLRLLLEDQASRLILEEHLKEFIKYDYPVQVLSMSLEQLSLHIPQVLTEKLLQTINDDLASIK